MKKLVLGLFIFGLTIQVHSQNIELTETLISVNYKYLEDVDIDKAPKRVKKLEAEVLKYKNKEQSKRYNDKNETYSVSFYVPEG